MSVGCFLLLNVDCNVSLLLRLHPVFECIICDVLFVSSSPLRVNMGITRLPSKYNATCDASWHAEPSFKDMNASAVYRQ